MRIKTVQISQSVPTPNAKVTGTGMSKSTVYPLLGEGKSGISCSGTCGERVNSKTRRCESVESMTRVLSCFECG